MKWCLGKHDDWVDITTYADSAWLDALKLCLRCGGVRHIYRKAECS